MKCTTLVKALQTIALTGLVAHGAAFAQEGLPKEPAAPTAPPPAAARPEATLGPVGNPSCDVKDCWRDKDSLGDWGLGDSGDSFFEKIYAGGDFLLIRPSFSEAIAFVNTTTLVGPAGVNRQVTASELNFDYGSSFRVFAGFQLDASASLQFTFWNLDAQTHVDGTVGQPNQTIVDPFGNTVKPGQSIQTQAGVRMNVYDIDYSRAFSFEKLNLGLNLTAGARIADVRQNYSAVILDPTAGVASRGDFTQSFVGAGPHLGLTGCTWLGEQKKLFLFVRADTALLLGDLKVASDVAFPGIAAGQAASRTRVIPVIGAELGIAWRPIPALTLSAGYQFQAWFDLGTSGGTFGGNFVEQDDSNIMSFDGLVLRATFSF